MIRTIIVDDEILSRIGIQSFIDGKRDIKVEGIFEGAEDALPYLREHTADIVITDIEMAQMNGLDFIKQIREEQLSSGVIILSSHDDFSYAQEAIANGTDSYLLKDTITEEKILSEIEKVYRKTKTVRLRGHLPDRMGAEASDGDDHKIKEGLYCVALFQVRSSENGLEADHLDNTMMTHLLDGIVQRYDMGTLLTPYNREMFIVLRFSPDMRTEEVSGQLSQNLDLLTKNLEQYITGNVVFGLSEVFRDLKEMSVRYEEAMAARDGAFYEPDKKRFFYRKMMAKEESYTLTFSTADFLRGEAGRQIFDRELTEYLAWARRRRLPVPQMKDQLIQAVTLMRYQLLRENHLEEAFQAENKRTSGWIETVKRSPDAMRLKERVLESMTDVQTQMKAILDRDEMTKVLTFIDQNLQRKITLNELTDLSCMSVPSFSKKFKERTGMTATEYINEQRIERAKVLLRDKTYSLWEVADLTGFSNANYLVRVFKKMTGKTVGEYRRSYGIEEKEQETIQN